MEMKEKKERKNFTYINFHYGSVTLSERILLVIPNNRIYRVSRGIRTYEFDLCEKKKL